MTAMNQRASRPASKQRTIAVAGATLVAASAMLMSHLGVWESGKSRVLVVYADKLAGGLPTVCHGLTRHITSTPIVVGERWTEEKCVAEEEAAVAKVQASLAKCFKRPPPQSVFDMGSSLAWNVGASAACGSGAMAAWNRGEWERGCRRISQGDDGQLVWSSVSRIDRKTGKKIYTFVRGLANRRADETKKCMADVPQAGLQPAFFILDRTHGAYRYPIAMSYTGLGAKS